MAYSVRDKVIIITGAAAGIGRATAQKLARLGAKIVISDVDERGLEETAAAIIEDQGEVLQFTFDVVSEGGWVEVLRQARSRFGGVDVLINNAGVYVIAPVSEISVEQWNQVMATNVTGVFVGVKHTVPYLLERGGGSIINMSSIAGLQGAFGHSLYSASKGAVRLLTKSLAAELASQNIRVNSVHPTYVDTAMFKYASKIIGMTEQDLGRRMSPMGRIASTSDVANMISFLSSDEANFLSGAEFVIDGAGTSSKML